VENDLPYIERTSPIVRMLARPTSSAEFLDLRKFRVLYLPYTSGTTYGFR